MKDRLQKILSELRTGKNVDIYATVVVCAILITLDVFNFVSIEVVATAILATLLLLALGTLNDRTISTDIQSSLARLNKSLTEIMVLRNAPSSDSFFTEWDNDRLIRSLSRAREISILAVAPYETLTDNSERLKERLQQGGRLRCLMVRPQGSALKMAADRIVGAEHDPRVLSAQILMTLQRLREFAESSPDSDNVQARVIDHLPSIIITMIDEHEVDRVMFVTLFEFAQPSPSRPGFVLTKEKDVKWFAYFQEHFERIWSWKESEAIDLSQDVLEAKW